MRKHSWFTAAIPLSMTALLLSGCLGGSSSSSSSSSPGGPDELTRAHDERVFVPVESEIAALPDMPTSRYSGIYEGLQGDAVYAVEVPEGWDGGTLVMYTHGYAGEGEELPLSVPNEAWRRVVLGFGYAWAASSYSANYYDARAGLEDTNKLALEAVNYILRDYGEQYNQPDRFLISGFSMGGHIAAAAIDRENRERTQFKVDYAGAAPFCQSEQNQFQWLGDYPRVMMELSGYGNEDYSRFQELVGEYQNFGGANILVRPGPIVDALFNQDGLGMPEWTSPKGVEGERLMAIAENLSGGERPIFEYGFAGPLQSIVLGTGGSSGDINGILALNGYGNQDQVYRWSTGPITPEEQEFNDNIARVTADEDANPLRDDGVRWIPLVNGEFDVPVLTMHTLGDFYVPFRHQQLYRERAQEHGNDHLLVQRAIRAPGHCDFAANEVVEAMRDWLVWVNFGIKPQGDEVLDPEVVADPDYGCAFTRDFLPVENPVSREPLPDCSAVL